MMLSCDRLKSCSDSVLEPFPMEKYLDPIRKRVKKFNSAFNESIELNIKKIAIVKKCEKWLEEIFKICKNRSILDDLKNTWLKKEYHLGEVEHNILHIKMISDKLLPSDMVDDIDTVKKRYKIISPAFDESVKITRDLINYEKELREILKKIFKMYDDGQFKR